QAVGRHVQFAIREPAVERGVRLIQHGGEGLGPDQMLAGEPPPEGFEVLAGFIAQRPVGFHAGHIRIPGDAFEWPEYPGFRQYRLNFTGHLHVSSMVILMLQQRMPANGRPERPTMDRLPRKWAGRPAWQPAASLA